MTEITRLLFMAVLGASLMLAFYGDYLSLSDQLALYTVVMTGYFLFRMLRKAGYEI